MEQPAGSDVADGDGRNFGSVNTGSATDLIFTIKNTGNADLTGLDVTIGGTNASEFTITESPSAPVSGPNGSTTFTIRFAPIASGLKTAALHIASNDADENPFDIPLTGTGISTNAKLANLTLSDGTLSPDFAPATDSYEASVPNSVTSITVTPTVQDPTATASVNGVAVASGNASAPIALNVGSNVITTIVTAEDGSTTMTYTVTVTRAPSSNAESLPH